MSYLRRTYRVDAEAEELVAAELWEQGTLGLETLASTGAGTLVAAYFAVPGAPAAWKGKGARMVAEERVEEEDWLARYRELALPEPPSAPAATPRPAWPCCSWSPCR
jgi:hypothetical protein